MHTVSQIFKNCVGRERTLMRNIEAYARSSIMQVTTQQGPTAGRSHVQNLNEKVNTCLRYMGNGEINKSLYSQNDHRRSLPPKNVQTPENLVLQRSTEEDDSLQRAAKLRLKRDQWKAASARYYQRHPEAKEKKRLKMSKARAAKKLARRRWDPPRAARDCSATVEQEHSLDNGAVDDDVDFETRDTSAEELRAARRARLEEFADQWVRQRKAEMLAMHAPVGEPPRAANGDMTPEARCLLLLPTASTDTPTPVTIASRKSLGHCGDMGGLSSGLCEQVRSFATRFLGLISAFSDDGQGTS
ncbi:hypothetical protein B0H14DRAFT_2631688 [Mycena olivaceomarginata]|nr:hypothetical protein B0H14DRAFT_2631688 [Mycena olivaceomarginata]